jgi:hypothetical protein
VIAERSVLFVETKVFTRRIAALGLEVALHYLQNELLERPAAGALDPGTGGLRKVRMPDPGRGRGKRGGARVHYLWLPHLDRIYLVFVYSKHDRETLTPDDKRTLKAVVQSIGMEP